MPQATEATPANIRKLVLDGLPAGGGENPLIFGGAGPLDSLGLVNYLADLEFRISQQFGRDVLLASDQAMSRSRSPFRDADSLVAYLQELLAE